jgi:AraC family transcriptional activator of pyochelin receptor
MRTIPNKAETMKTTKNKESSERNVADGPIFSDFVDKGLALSIHRPGSRVTIREWPEINERFIQLHICTQGEAQFFYNERKYAQKIDREESMILFNSQQNLELDVDLSPNALLISLFIQVSQFHQYVSDFSAHIPFIKNGEFQQKHYAKEPLSTPLVMAASQLSTTRESGSFSSLFYRGKAYELLSLYFGQSEHSVNNTCPFLNDADFMLKVHLAKEILLENMSTPPTIYELSERVGVSLKKLKTGFKEVYGSPISEFLLESKMNKALKQLDQTDISVNDLSAELGYSSPSHFIQSFKKRFGTTPKQYNLSRNKK